MNSEFKNNLDSDFSNKQSDFAFFFNLILSKRKIFLFSFLSIFLISVAYTFYNYNFRPIYRGNFSLLITDPLNNNKYNKPNTQGDIISDLALNTTTNDTTTLVEVLKSNKIIEPVALENNILPDVLSRRISIAIGGGIRRYERAEGILLISLTGRNRSRIGKVLQDLSKLYLNTALEQRQKRLSDGLNFLNSQEPKLQEKTREIQTKIEEFRVKHNLIEPLGESAILRENKRILDKKISNLEIEKKRLLKARLEIVNGILIANSFKEDIGTSSDNNVRGNSGLDISKSGQGLLDQYAKLEAKIAEASATFRQDSSVIKSLKAKLDQIKPILISKQLETVDIALALNESRKNDLTAQVKKNNELFLLKPNLIKEYETYQQRLGIVASNLKALVEAKEILQLEIAQSSFPWSIISEPFVSRRPIRPLISRNLLLGFVISVLGGAGIVFLRDRLDNVFHTSSDVFAINGLPILASIPYLDSIKNYDNGNILEILAGGKKSKSQYQSFYFQESLREFFTSIRFLSVDKPLKVIAITSSIPSEGKSFSNILLSKALSEFDQKVLLIDGDMRRPTIHKRLASDNILGLSNLLVNHSLNWRDALKTYSDKDSKFKYITAGKIPPNASRLLSSQRLKNLVNEIRNSEEFDYVIFDTPPVLGISDTILVTDIVDCSVLLISLENVDKNLTKQSIEKLESSSKPLIGTIVNTIKLSTEENANRRYGYSYKYGKYGKYGYNNPIYAYYGNESNEEKQLEKELNEDEEIKFENKFIPEKLSVMKKYISNYLNIFKKFLKWLDE